MHLEMTYKGDLRVETRHPNGAVLLTDAPLDDQGRGEEFSPTDLVATALGACILTVMGIVARRQNVDISGATASVEKTMAVPPARRLGTIDLTINLPAGIAEDVRARLERAAMTCPVKPSLHPDVNVTMNFVWG